MKIGGGVVVAAVIAVLVAASGLLLAGCGGGSAESVSDAATSYAIIGDTPYGTAQIENFPNDVAEINADPEVQLTIHLGDIKDSASRCSTSYFQSIRSDFDRFDQPRKGGRDRDAGGHVGPGVRG